jgi:Protein of unknown function (DUF3617)
MKFLLSLIPLAALSASAVAQTLPSAGMWELSMAMEGAPMGGGAPRGGKACLAADALAGAPEQTLCEAAGRQGDSSRTPPKCEFRDIQRNGANSSWQSACDGPMGKMQGAGSGALGAETADLQQTFNVKGPVGQVTLKQTLRARRVGSC